MTTPKFADRFQVTATASAATLAVGATLTCGAAASGCRTLAQCIADGDLAIGDTVPMFAADTANAWQDSDAVITSTTVLTVTAIRRSSAGGTTAVTFNGGALSAYNAPPASLLTALAALTGIVVSPSAPNNADGRPDGSLWVQSAT